MLDFKTKWDYLIGHKKKSESEIICFYSWLRICYLCHVYKQVIFTISLNTFVCCCILFFGFLLGTLLVNFFSIVIWISGLELLDLGFYGSCIFGDEDGRFWFFIVSLHVVGGKIWDLVLEILILWRKSVNGDWDSDYLRNAWKCYMEDFSRDHHRISKWDFKN